MKSRLPAVLIVPAVALPGGGAEPARHWFALPLWKTQWGLAPGGICSPCKPGTRRELNLRGAGSTCPGGGGTSKPRKLPPPDPPFPFPNDRSPSPPVPPLLGCRHCSPVPRPNRNATAGHRNASQSHPQGAGARPPPDTTAAGRASAAGVQAPGMQGAEPLA